MTTWTPQTQLTETKCISPYYYTDRRINGFRGTHWLNSGYVQDYGTVSLMPYAGTIGDSLPWPSSAFSHDTEIVTPAYYAVQLPDYQIKAFANFSKNIFI